MRTTYFLILILISILLPNFSKAQDNLTYATFRIPQELQDDAHSVIRRAKESFEVISPSRAIHTVQMLVTILNDKSTYQDLVVPYDPI